MALSVFDDPLRRPEAARLRQALGPAHALWSDLVAKATTQCPELSPEWHFAGPKYGWALRLKRQDRTAVHLIPGAGCFLVGVVLGARVVAGAEAGRLSKKARAVLETAPRYAEGIGVRMPVGSAGDLRVAMQFVRLKVGGGKRP